MPIVVERANLQKPHAEYDIYYNERSRAHDVEYVHIHKASTACYILDYD
ncbi:MAG: hypothetical protein K2N91_09060 [Muribaculaceae bacterium]|nr:hypothetical protein [Muribaculaceae bacterium]